jgi:EmrB/QacA subfamily drug resistance transporter
MTGRSMTPTDATPEGGAAERDMASDAGRSRSRWWALVIISLAQLMVVMDMTVVIVALPSAQRSLTISDTTRQWVVTAYTLAYGGLLLLGGRLADRAGQRRTLLVAVIGFAIVSAVSGSAVDGTMLIASRAVQGAFGALLVPSATSFVALLFPVSERRARAKAIGVFSAIAITGAAFGFVLGGVLTAFLSWRWCLYVNVPLSAAALLGAVVVLPDPSRSQEVRLDVPGAILACGGMVGLVYALGAAASDGWSSRVVIGSLAIAALLIATFVVRQAYARSPLLPLRVVTERNRAGSFIARALLGFGQFAMFLFLTYQFQAAMGFSPIRAGLALVPLLAANAVGSVGIAPQLIPRVPPRLLIVPGILLNAAGLFLLARLTPTTPYLPLILSAEVLLGLGGGLTVTPSLNTALTGVDPADTGTTSGMASASQQIGASIGTALLNSIAASATGAYLALHARPTSTNAAIVHGYTVAATWGAGIVLVGAVLVAVLVDADLKPRQAKEARARTRQP